MFTLSKIAAWFFLTPLLFITPMILAMTFIKKKKTAAAYLVLLFVTVISAFMSLRLGHDLILNPLENRVKQIDLTQAKPELIIILGGGIINKSQESQGAPVLSNSSTKRVIAGYKLWRKNTKAKIIVCGGTPLKTGTPEAKVMARELISYGVDPDRIYCEPYSRNTYENINNALKLVKQKRNNIYLVTTAMHMPRTLSVCNKFGLRVMPVLCDYRIDKDDHHWYDIFPEAENIADSFSGIKEYIGIIYYKTFYKTV